MLVLFSLCLYIILICYVFHRKEGHSLVHKVDHSLDNEDDGSFVVFTFVFVIGFQVVSYTKTLTLCFSFLDVACVVLKRVCHVF